jgi:hypothetical protein
MASSIFSIILFSGVFALACCIISLLDHSQKGQVLYRLKR